jgi:hypothetical protein
MHTLIINSAIITMTNMALSQNGFGSHENMGNSLSTWIPIISLIISLLLTFINMALYKTNKKAFTLLYSKPIPEIIKIDTSPTIENGGGGFVSRCSMQIRVYNPSSSGNYIKIGFRQKKKTLVIIDWAKTPTRETPYSFIPPFGNIYIGINLHHDEAKNHIGQTLTLLIVDIRNNESRLDFIFKNLQLL